MARPRKSTSPDNSESIDQRLLTNPESEQMPPPPPKAPRKRRRSSPKAAKAAKAAKAKAAQSAKAAAEADPKNLNSSLSILDYMPPRIEVSSVIERIKKYDRSPRAEAPSPPPNFNDDLTPSPDLFPEGRTLTRMATALPLWEASNILTQGQDLPWENDRRGKLRYARTVENGKGAVHFWVTEDLDEESPSTLAGAAALAVIDTFDIRAACMHLIYAAHAAQLDRPWEEEFVIDDHQIAEYLGLQKRTDKNKQKKLALIQEIATQPCKITTFVSWPNQDKIRSFSLEEGRLWHLLGTRYHYQQGLFGNKELTGVTFVLRAGLWARYFLNEEGRYTKSSMCEYGTLSKALLKDVMGVWQQREGAARLMVWLLFKTGVDRHCPQPVSTLMEVAFGSQQLELAKYDGIVRKKFVGSWDDTLLLLKKRGWSIEFDPETYPPELRPSGINDVPVPSPPSLSSYTRPRGFLNQLLEAYIQITPPESWNEELLEQEEQDYLAQVESAASVASVQMPSMTGASVRSERILRGWSQRKLSALTGLSQALISQLESGGRSLTPDTQALLEQIFALNS